MTLLGIPGRVERRYLLRFPGSEVTYDVVGHASGGNVRRDINDMRERARNDAVYKLTYRLNKAGNDNAVTYDINIIARLYGPEKITYYQLTASKDRESINKQQVTPKRENWKGHYKLVVRRSNGQIISYTAWSAQSQDEQEEQDL
jgi:putative lipoic acid-binding regulatory protein